MIKRLILWVLSKLHTDLFVEELTRRHSSYIIILINSEKKEQVRGGKDDGAVNYEMNGRAHWYGMEAPLRQMMDQVGKEINIAFMEQKANADRWV